MILKKCVGGERILNVRRMWVGLVAILWCSHIIVANHYSIVFVHLGTQLPSYVRYALEQARLFNQTAPIYLIANREVVVDAQNRQAISDQNVDVIWCEDLEISGHHREFLKSSSLDNSSRDGFWRKATERLFYLDEFMTQYGLKNVFHLEYDNMLYVDLSSLVPTFETYGNIAATFDNDRRCILGFVYIAHPYALTHLMKFFAKHANRGFNDMQIPVLYLQEFGREYIDYLPIIPPSYAQHNVLQSSSGHTTRHADLYFNKFCLFDSIFDAAALGQYLGGIDPRNDPRNTVGFVNETCLFNPYYFSYIWLEDDLQRKVPHIVYRNQVFRINNLHVHSKNLLAFKS